MDPIKIAPMLADIPYMDPMGICLNRFHSKAKNRKKDSALPNRKTRNHPKPNR